MLDRREFLAAAAALPAVAQTGVAAAIPETHFPNRVCQFVWRNWELANVERMAAVLGTTARNVLRLGAEMGLPAKRTLTSDQLRRIYVTVIRQNWHLLSAGQLVELLGWDEARLEFTLKEDDFLDHKLGPKPACQAVRYAPPAADEKRAMAGMRKLVREVFGDRLARKGADLCGFGAELSDARNPEIRRGAAGKGWTAAVSADARLTRAGERFVRYVRESFSALCYKKEVRS